ncbi:unnamed protein product [Sphagnum jensenii]
MSFDHYTQDWQVTLTKPVLPTRTSETTEEQRIFGEESAALEHFAHVSQFAIKSHNNIKVKLEKVETWSLEHVIVRQTRTPVYQFRTEAMAD